MARWQGETRSVPTGGGSASTKADLSVPFGLATAGAYGTSDYVAKTATDRTGFVPTVLFLELLGTPFLVALAWLLEAGRPVPIGAPLALLVALSVLVVAGAFNLFRAFEYGQLSIVSPLASGYPALVVVLSVIVLGERFTVSSGLGIALTILGMVLVTRTPPPDGRAPPPKNPRLGLLSALAAFVVFAVFYFGLKFVVGPIPPVSAAAISRGVGAATVVGYLALTRGFPALPQKLWGRWIGIAVLDSSANVLYNFGVVFSSSLAVLATLSGLFSAVTVGLAVVFLGERLGRVQWSGVAAIFAGVALLSYF